MWGTRCNLEKDRAMKGCKVMAVFVSKYSQNHGKKEIEEYSLFKHLRFVKANHLARFDD